MKITTFARYKWDGSRYVLAAERSHQYNGPVSLSMGMSDGDGGPSGASDSDGGWGGSYEQEDRDAGAALGGGWGADESSSPDTDSFGGNFGASNFGGGGWESSYEDEDMAAGVALGSGPGVGGFAVDVDPAGTYSMYAVNMPDQKMSLDEALSKYADTLKAEYAQAAKTGAQVGSRLGLFGAAAGALVGMASVAIQNGMTKAEVAAQMAAEFGPSVPKETVNKAVDEAWATAEIGGGAEHGFIGNPSVPNGKTTTTAEAIQSKGYSIDPVTGKMNFTSYDEALKYAVGSAAQRSDEAWELYKQYQQPYEQEFYEQAKTLIEPSMKLSLAYIDSQSKLLPAQTEASQKYWDSVGKGIDPKERMDTAEANVVGAFDKAGETARDMIVQYGINPNNATFQRGMQGAEIEKAKAIAGARTGAGIDTEAENFARLQGAETLRRGISVPGQGQGVTSPSATASGFGSQAQAGASSGISAQNTAAGIAANTPYKPSFTDLLVSEALKGIGSTDWSKVF